MLKATQQAQLPSSAYFYGVKPAWSTVRADLIASGFNALTTTGSGTNVSSIWIDLYPVHKNISPNALPRTDYDYYNLDTAILVTLSS